MQANFSSIPLNVNASTAQTTASHDPTTPNRIAQAKLTSNTTAQLNPSSTRTMTEAGVCSTLSNIHPIPYRSTSANQHQFSQVNTNTLQKNDVNSDPTSYPINYPISYQSGFKNHFSTEAIPNALPVGRNNPQRCPYGLYAEQISGSAFTVSRDDNLRTWMYRLLPSVNEFAEFKPASFPNWQSNPASGVSNPNQLRWSPPYAALNESKPNSDFIDSIFTIANNDVGAVHWYNTNQPMNNRFFYNADAEMMIVPQAGALQLKTEMGLLTLHPKEIAVIPRGISFQVNPIGTQATGYLCENWEAPFILPDRGPIGANGLANEVDFQYPVAWFEDIDYDQPAEAHSITHPAKATNEIKAIKGDIEEGLIDHESQAKGELVCKYQHQLHSKPITHSPLNVVAWKGNYAPYKYHLDKFNTMNSVSFDHPDPSIFTVMTSQSNSKGTANIDFVIFPPRWMVAEETFRPPYFHRNIMGEMMGLIHGEYDAKKEGFEPGGISIHNPMTCHGPEVSVFESASNSQLTPFKLDDTLAFMFESRFAWNPTQQALDLSTRDSEYTQCWTPFQKADLSTP